MIGATKGSTPGQEAKPAPTTILVVEDEVLVRMLIADQLRNAGYSVIEAADADEALALLAHTFNVNVVLSDVQMPGSLDGAGLARIVRSNSLLKNSRHGESVVIQFSVTNRRRLACAAHL